MIFNVVDTNVPIVANGKSEQACSRCVNACIDALQDIYDTGGVVLDDRWRIISEYQNKLSSSGQPGPGDAFMKWVLNHKANVERCECVQITEHETRGFEEFPDDPRLCDFDKSDRKFVAVALASRNRPEILNAVDSDWWDARKALTDCGLKIRFVYPDQFSGRGE